MTWNWLGLAGTGRETLGNTSSEAVMATLRWRVQRYMQQGLLFHPSRISRVFGTTRAREQSKVYTISAAKRSVLLPCLVSGALRIAVHFKRVKTPGRADDRHSDSKGEEDIRFFPFFFFLTTGGFMMYMMRWKLIGWVLLPFLPHQQRHYMHCVIR